MEQEKRENQPEATAGRSTLRRIWELTRRFVALVVTILLVVGAVYVVVHRDDLSVDSLRRAILYRSSGDEEQATRFPYSGDTSSSFATLNGGLLVCSDTALELFTRSGETAVEESARLAQPVISASGDYAVAYDAGGSQLYLLHNSKITQRYTSAKENGILSARVNANGYLALVEQATGYKASVTVYNADFQPVVTENISSSFVSDAAVSLDGKQLVLVSVGEDSTGFDSVLIFYNLSDGSESGRCVLGSDVVLDLDWEKSALWVAGEYGAYRVEDGAITASYTDTTQYLQGISLGGDGYAALYFSKYQNGSSGELEILDADGTVRSLAVNEELLSISACGNYLAVLTGSELTIYKSDLSVYATAENSWSARRVLMRSDGSAMLISTGNATLYSPD
jgi:hypothetical protein